MTEPRFSRFSRFVMLESPYVTSGYSREQCVRYALWCCYDSLVNHHECQIASHLFWTQFLPEDQKSRELGLAARDFLARVSHATTVRYVDLGKTVGMFRDVDCTRPIEERRLPTALLKFWVSGQYPKGSLKPEVV